MNSKTIISISFDSNGIDFRRCYAKFIFYDLMRFKQLIIKYLFKIFVN